MRKGTSPALVGNLSPSKRGVVTRDGAYVMYGTTVWYLTARELDALHALRQEYQAARLQDLQEGT